MPVLRPVNNSKRTFLCPFFTHQIIDPTVRGRYPRLSDVSRSKYLGGLASVQPQSVFVSIDLDLT